MVEAEAQPKWMREGAERPRRPGQQPPQQELEPMPGRRGRSREFLAPANVTDEAIMLESSRPAPHPRHSASLQRPERRLDSGADSSRDHSPAMPSRLHESLPQTQPASLTGDNHPLQVLSPHSCDSKINLLLEVRKLV